jgi:hypothetical protein
VVLAAVLLVLGLFLGFVRRGRHPLLSP